jgi:hypothetical protein
MERKTGKFMMVARSLDLKFLSERGGDMTRSSDRPH